MTLCEKTRDEGCEREEEGLMRMSENLFSTLPTKLSRSSPDGIMQSNVEMND